ncbi:MAG: hypothetical protein PGN37_01180 [Mycobacterium kyogaense]|uniref:hypothetical protein n=1 Tax=Mycobacterium kyogaense TaxID=2212479 RepID=UPI002FFB1DE3
MDLFDILKELLSLILWGAIIIAALVGGTAAWRHAPYQSRTMYAAAAVLGVVFAVILVRSAILPIGAPNFQPSSPLESPGYQTNPYGR